MTSAIPISQPESADRWGQVLDIDCVLTLEIPIPAFTVRDLLRLTPGSTIATHWSASEDLPVHANEQAIAWATFEAKGDRLAARLAELV